MTHPVSHTRSDCFWASCPNKNQSNLKVLRCAKCKSAFYCGTSCQKKDWKRHKIECWSPNKSEQIEQESSSSTGAIPPNLAIPDLIRALSSKEMYDGMRKRHWTTEDYQGLEEYWSCFLRDPLDEEEFFAQFMWHLTNQIKAQVFSSLNGFYPDMEKGIGLSEQQFSEEFFNVFIDEIQPSLIKQSETASRFWSSSKLEDRLEIAQGSHQFFSGCNYNPSEEQLDRFVSAQECYLFQWRFIKNIIASFRTASDFLNNPDEFKKAFRGALNKARDTLIQPILQERERKANELMNETEEQIKQEIEELLGSCLDELEKAKKAAKTALELMTKAVASSDPEALRKAELARHRAKTDLIATQQRVVESQLKAKKITQDSMNDMRNQLSLAPGRGASPKASEKH